MSASVKTMMTLLPFLCLILSHLVSPATGDTGDASSR